MGNVCSPSFSCDDSVSHCLDCSVRKAGYICHLQDNLDALQRELQMLIEERNDVRVRVIVAEQQQMKRLERVQGWLSRVEKVESRVGKLIRKSPQQVEKICLGGFCSNSCKSSYKFGKKVVKALRLVQSLRKQGDFQDVAQPAPENPVDERPLPATVVGLQSTFDGVWKCLMEEQMGIVGLYGMGGVGKTTLLTQINNKFLDTPNSFDFVIWIVVSKDLQLAKIQEGIAKKIGLFNESWQSKGLEEKANKIFKILSKKKFVLLLDDIWELVDLAQVGLPVSSCASASNKIVFTTREIEVCGQMEAHRSFKVECLGFDDAWKLFEEKVGRDTLDTHPEIPELAEAVARECGGLPLALITVGRAMASRKTPREWEHAIEVLRCSASQFSGMEKRVFSRLKFSYDFLPNDAARFCLLYCSLFPEDYRISIEDLIDCWICEEFLDESNGIGVRNQGYSLVRTLLHSCLLEEEEDNFVKMHDVIRDMALWIASTTEEREKFLVLAGVGLIEAPRIRMWKGVTRMSLMTNQIENLLESPVCPRLRTLFLSSNIFHRVNSDFFQSMASLRVLKLSYSNPLLFEISKVVSLQHLDLSHSRIERLPIEFKYLVNLKCLNLEYTYGVLKIPPKVISNLKILQTLRMYECATVPQARDSILFGDCRVLVEELLCLEHLSVFTITLNNFHALQRLLDSCMLQYVSTPSLCLSHFNNSKSLGVFSLASLRHLQTLHLTYNDLEEIKIDNGGEVKRVRELSAPNLKRVEIENCQDMEEIISSEKLSEVPAEVMENLIPFARLERLILEELKNLKTIHSKALPFPCLKEMSVDGCPLLKKLPLDLIMRNFGSVKEEQDVI
ncbi:hypothetical protein CICLE_v10027589mg [Citrus x clementina]|uniref:AAA+ ATPase domain-containing protein n=1 Tax=Citrus clementina TaxID=85681 RepID=V4ULW6_CITCL|nr:hypothetical protein CICLE_v10027589mg [Citrus x clementina]